MELQKAFIGKVNTILEEVDFEKLLESANGQDQSYAMDTLKQLHQAFVDTYGTDCITDHPFVAITDGTLICHTILHEEVGVPMFPGAFHVNFESIPHKVETLLRSCTGITPTQDAPVLTGMR